MQGNAKAAGWQSGAAYDKEITTFSKMADRISQEQKNREPKSIVVKMTEDVVELKEEWRTKMFGDLFSQMVTDSGATENSGTDPSLLERAKTEMPGVASYFDYLNTGVNGAYYGLLHKDGKWALLQLDFEPKEQDEYLKIPLMARKKAPLKCINVTTNSGFKPTKKGQTKWVEESVRQNFSDLTSLGNRVKKHMSVAFA